MNNIQKIKGFRQFLLRQIEGLNAQQLNNVPPGHNNNIIWNLGHMIAASLNMTYVKSGLKVPVDDKFFSPYLSGTKPVNPLDQSGCDELKREFIAMMDQLQADYDKNLFLNYTPPAVIAKVYGFEVNNIDDAIAYLLYHEGLHTSKIQTLKSLSMPK